MMEKYAILVNDEIICYAEGKKNANFIALSVYQMRGFFSDDFSEPSISIKDYEGDDNE